jgi:fructokinase
VTSASGAESRPCIAVLGERIIDLVPDDRGTGFQAHPGGSPANVALGLARLGVRPLLLGRRAADAFADLLDNNLTASGLSLEGFIDGGGLSMLAVCSRQPEGSMSYSFYTADSPDLRWSESDVRAALQRITASGAVAWHTGSLVSWLGSDVSTLLAAWQGARQAGQVTLSYDPNARPQALDAEGTRSWVEQFARSAHVVKASDEDIAYCYPNDDVEQVCARWVQTGPVIVVLTRGARGATVWQRGHEPVDVPGIAVDVVDTVGAGDTLTAGLLGGLAPWFGPGGEDALARLDPGELRRIVEGAAVAAAITCSRPGADPPTLDERDRLWAQWMPEQGTSD